MEKPLRVLIVEDNEDDALLLLRALRQGGYSPVHRRVESADALRSALSEETWDCVISDYSLPQFNAPAVLGILRQSGVDIPCLVVSGTITESMAVETMRAGAHDYLMKDNLTRLTPALERELQEAVMRSERRVADTARRESDDRFRATFENVALGMAHVGLDGRWIHVNRKLCDIVGYSEAELCALTFQDITYPDDLVKDLAHLRRLTDGEIASYALEKRYNRKDGTPVWVDLTVSLVREPSGAPKYYISVIEDITERKRTEGLLRQRQVEIEALNVRLRRSMQETHHRIKNNLQIISALVDVQAMDADNQAIPVAAVRQLGAQIRTLASVHDILTNELKTEGTDDTISAAAVMENLVRLVQKTIGKSRITLNVPEARLTPAQGTSIALLTNELISNSQKHGSSAVHVTLQELDGAIRLEVADDGPGFPPDFDPSTAANTGLELVESIARWDLRGDIRYENREGECGARVIVTFPFRGAGNPEPAP